MTLHYATLDGRLLPVMPSRFRTIVILMAFRAGYHNFQIKEMKR